MKKRIGIIFVLIFAILGFTACNSDPYSKMKMTVNTNDIALTLIDEDNEISGSSMMVDVSVDAPKNIDKGIVLPKYGARYGNEYVNVEIASTDGDGNYSLKFTALQVGNSEIQIKSKEGYVSQTIRVNIEVKIKSLDFTSEASNTGVVVEAGTEYNLNTYRDSLINFEPSYTSQRAVKFTIAEGGVDKVDATKNNYCIIEDNILKVGSGYSNKTVKIKAQSVASLENTELTTSNTLKVTIVKPLDMSADITTTLTPENSAAENIAITQTGNMSSTSVAYYDLVFASPEGEHSTNEGVFGGSLKFELNRTDFEITLGSGQSTVVDVNDLGGVVGSKTYEKSFNFMAKESDEEEDVIQFKVTYKGKSDYDGLQTKYIRVRVKVVSLPTNQTVLINGTPYSQAKTFAVYDGIASEMIIESTNNKEMTFKLSASAGSFDINSSVAGASYIEVKKGNELIETGETLTSGDVLYFKNCTKEKALVDLRVTLTVSISNEHYSTHGTTSQQQYSMEITIKVNLITGLNELVIDDVEVDIENDKDGVVLPSIVGGVKASYTLPEGVVASGVVESISIGNSSLFTYEFVDNNIIIYPHPYTPGDTTINEGMTSIVIRLNNGVVSKTSAGEVTKVTVKASYLKDGSDNPIVVTNIDTESDGFFSWGSIKNGSYTAKFENDANYYKPSTTNEIQEYTSSEGWTVSYSHGENVILSTYSELSLDLYKLFVYKDEKGKVKIGDVNVNKLTARCYNSEGNQTNNVTWDNGVLKVGAETSWDDVESKHKPFELRIYDNVTGTIIHTINVYVCHRIGKIQITKKHFDLYDTTDSYLNKVYESKATAKVELVIYPIMDGKISTSGIKITELSTDALGQYGNLYFSSQMLYKDSVVYDQSGSQVLKENLITIDNDDPYIFTAQADSGFKDIIKNNIYNMGKTQKVSYSGILEQFTQQFPVEFDFSISRPTKISSIITNVSDPGIYFKLDDDNKQYQFKYNYYSSSADLNDVYVVVNNGGSVMPVLVYAEKDGDTSLYKYYESGFNADTFLGDNIRSESEWNISSGYFVVTISKNGCITITAKNCGAGTYKVTVASVASFDSDMVGTTFDFNIADGTSANPYQLMGVLDFEEFLINNGNANPSEPSFKKEYYVISKDIYLNKVYSKLDMIGKPLVHNLSGLYNGNRYSIYGLKISLSDDVSQENVALFSSLYDGVVLSNVSVENAEITIETNSTTLKNVAILVGSLTTGQVYGCRVYGTINFTNTGTESYNIGGMVGSYTGGEILAIPSNVSVNNSDISATVNINYISSNDVSSNLGGIVGYSNNVKLDNLRAVATIVAKKVDGNKDSDYVKANIGGVVGQANGTTIINVISYPILVGYGNIGGIVGSASGSSTISYSQAQLLYNINMKNVIAGVGNIGGIVGNADDSITLDYVYVRSYISKNINMWKGENIAFYTSYKNEYYGGVIALSGDSNIGGLLGNGKITASNSYFNSHLVSFESDSNNLNIGGIVGLADSTTLKDAYVNAKILIANSTRSAFIKSNNMITAPTSITQKFGAPTSENIAIVSYDGTSTNYLEDVGSYVTMVITRKWENATVTYTASYSSLSLSNYYSFTNNNMFGVNTTSLSAKYSYKTHSDKTEIITLVIYKAGDNDYRMLGKKVVLENTSNGQVYSEYLLESETQLSSNDIVGLSDDIKEQLVGLGLSSVKEKTGDGSSSSFGKYDDIETSKFEYTAKYLTATAISNISSTPSDEDYAEDYTNFFNAFTGNSSTLTGTEALTKAIDAISEKCESEITNPENVNKLTLTKKYNGTTIAESNTSGYAVVFATTFDFDDGRKLVVRSGAKSGNYSLTNEVYASGISNYILNIPSQIKKIDTTSTTTSTSYYKKGGGYYKLVTYTTSSAEAKGLYKLVDGTDDSDYTKANVDLTVKVKWVVESTSSDDEEYEGLGTTGSTYFKVDKEHTCCMVGDIIYILDPVSVIVEEYQGVFDHNADENKYITSDNKYTVDVDNQKVYIDSSEVTDAKCFINQRLEVASRDVELNIEDVKALYGKSDLKDVFPSSGFNFVSSALSDSNIPQINEFKMTILGKTITVSVDVSAITSIGGYIEAIKTAIGTAYSSASGESLNNCYLYIEGNQLYVLSKDYSDYAIDKISLEYTKGVVDADGNAVYETDADGNYKLDESNNKIQETTQELDTYNVIGRTTISFTDKDGSTSLAKWVIDDNVNGGLPANVFVNSSGSYGDSTNTPALGNEFSTNYKLYYDELINLSIKALDFKQKAGNDYISEDTLNPHGHIKVNETTVALMYNKPLDNNSDDNANNYYITYGKDDSGVYVAQLDGEEITLENVEVGSDLQLYITTSDTGVVTIERDGNNKYKLTTQGEGKAEINFYNLKDDSIKATLTVYVIKGFTNFTINSSDNSSSEIKLLVGAEESTDAVFSFVNETFGRNYEANKGGFKLTLTSIDGKNNGFSGSSDYSSIMVNGKIINANAFAGGETEFDFDGSVLNFVATNRGSVVGTDQGKMKFEVVPYVIIGGNKVYMLALEKTLTIEITTKAEDISFMETSSEQLPEEEKAVTVTFFSNDIAETLWIKITGSDIADVRHNIGTTGYEVGDIVDINDSLLRYRVKTISHDPIIKNGVNLYKHTFTLAFYMNSTTYQEKTQNTGYNAIASSVSYTIVAYPESHWGSSDAIYSTYSLKINPVKATKLSAKFYPYLSTYNGETATTETNKINAYSLDQIYDINALPVGEYGLLKIETNPKYNNTLILQIQFDSKYTGMINFRQVTPAEASIPALNTNGYFKSLTGTNLGDNININNTFVLWETPYYEEYTLASGSSYREWYFNEYYVALHLSKSCPENVTIPITITAFDANRNQILSYTINLKTEAIPHASITIDGSSSVIKGVDEYVPLQISAKNYTTLNFECTSGITSGIYTRNNDGTYTQVANINTSYNNNTQYYIRTFGSSYAGSIGKIELTLEASNTINGREISATSTATIQVVWLLLESVVEPDVISGTITLKTGMYKGLHASAVTNKTTADIKAIESAMAGNGESVPKTDGMTLSEYLEAIQNEIAGRGISNIISHWFYNAGSGYTLLEAPRSYNQFTFSRYDGSDEAYYRISAIQISTLQFKLGFYYAYDSNGCIVIGSSVSKVEEIVPGAKIFAYDYEFQITIKDNSNEDHPIPIYSAEDLMAMEKDVNYILQSDITLTAWKPMAFNSAYLDGNGYTIILKSFDMSDIKGKDEAYAGIFKTIAEGCILKNITIDVSNLLYNDTTLASVKNDKTNPNIDLRETPSVYFGIVAGENLGTIINAKVVNLNLRNSGNTLYVAVTRNYFSYGEDKIMSQGNIGGLVAINTGTITNSYIGVNSNNKVERTQRKDDGSNDCTNVYTTIYGFKIESCNNVGGFVWSNGGVITNSYIKGISIINNSRVSDTSSTAGFVVNNSGSIYSSAVTTNNIEEFKSKDTVITSSSTTGGFVYTNSGTIEDSYTNIQIDNQNVETAGFVYSNENGSIKNSYTTSKNTKIKSGLGNTDSHKMFVYNKNSYGTIENCYYLIYANELGKGIDTDDVEILRNLDPANAIIVPSGGKVEKSLFDGFNFASNETEYDGVWYLGGGGETFPELAYAENVDYYSARSLVNISKTYFELLISSGDLGVEIYQEDGSGGKEILDSKNSLGEKTNVWYFNNGDYLFEVVGSIITEVNSSTKMETTLNTKDTDSKNHYYEFIYAGTTYQWYFNQYLSNFGNKVRIDVEHYFLNCSFEYLGFEFVTIVDQTYLSKTYSMITNDSFSIVTLAEEDKTVFSYGGNSTYTYMYAKNNLGSKYNPIIVTNPLEFAKNIVNNTNEYLVEDNGKTKRLYIFGLTDNGGDGAYARYIHIANNISFQNDGSDENNTADINIASKYEVNNSTAKITINDVIFNGVLIGNSMAIDNIVLNSTETRENYGIFNEVGVNDYNRVLLRNAGTNLSDIATAQVFNVKLNYKELSNSDANKVGLLAGTISNAVINKVDISGVKSSNTNYKIQGKNLTGALAGYIYGYNGSTKISEITVNNVSVVSSTNKLNNLELDKLPTDQSYTEFKASKTSVEQGVTSAVNIAIEWKLEKGVTYSTITNLNKLSYAGSIAGAIVMDAKIDSTATTTVSGEGTTSESETIINNDYLRGINTYYSYNELRKSTNYEYVSDLQVGGMVNIQSDISGGIAGYIGTGSEKNAITIEDSTGTTTSNIEARSFASNLKFILDDDVDQFIFGYAYAGGIVGQSQNAYFREVNVTHLEEEQNKIDAKINDEKFTSSDVSSERLFWKGAGDNDSKIEEKHNVAIGGIVGDMHGSWIVDSSSKANVENSNSFIAGGIAGRVTGSNYLAFVYTIGNVLGKNMIGGIVGYYYNTGTTYDLHMNNVFGVNIWASSIKDLLSVNEKAYKYTYSGGTITPSANPDAFAQLGEFNTMPELGNQQVVKTPTLGEIFKEGSDTDKKDYSEKQITIKIDPNYSGFASYERFTYIGSVVGRYTKYDSKKTSETMSNITFYKDMEEIAQVVKDGSVVPDTLKDIVGRSNTVATAEGGATTEEYYTYYNNNNFNVISSTYGNVKHEGSIAEGDYLSTIKDDKVYLSHFKTIYTAKENSDRYDNHSYTNFSPMFGNQYYVSYITGDFFINLDTSENYGNKYYCNEFTNYYSYVYKVVKGKSYSKSDKFVNDGIYLTKDYLDVVKGKNADLKGEMSGDGLEASFVWYVDAEYYLAKYGYNANSTLIQIDSNTTLDTAFLSGKSDMMYRFVENNDVTDPTADKYTFTSGVTGKNRITLSNNTYYASSDHPVTINFTIDSGSSEYNNLFNLIMGCSFVNITFNINIGVTELGTSNADNYYGAFASVIQSSAFNNCHFVVTAPSEIALKGSDDDSFVSSFGLIMGLASNSTFVNCTFETKSSSSDGAIIVKDNGSLINFGAIASYVFQSVFVMSATTDDNIKVGNVTLSGVNQGGSLESHNFGRVFGNVQNSTLNNVVNNGKGEIPTFTVSNAEIGAGNYNIGAFAGKIQGSSNLSNLSISATYDYTINGGSGTVNAGIIGYTDGISIGNDETTITITSGANKITTSTSANVGIIGLAEGETSLNSTFQNVNVSSGGITAKFNGGNTTHNVGAFIGRKTGSTSLIIAKCVIDCPLRVDVKYNKTNTANKSYTRVGGFAGMSAGLTIKQSVTLNELRVTAVDDAGAGQVSFNNEIAIGGAIGYNSSGSVVLTNVITYGDMYYYVNASESKNFRAGGFVGNLNNKTLTATYALALGNFINYYTNNGVNYSQVNGIATNYNSLNLTHTHYIAEHSPKTAYDSSSTLVRTSDDDDSVAWMYYKFINSTGYLDPNNKPKNNATDNNEKICYIDLGTSRGKLQAKVYDLTYDLPTGSKYRPTTIVAGGEVSTSTIASGKYYIIGGTAESPVKLENDIDIQSGAVLTSANPSGAVVNLGGHKISTNNGTIANIIFSVPAGAYDGAYVVTINNGYLMNVGISGSGTSSYTFGGTTSAPVGTNNGGIYAVGTLISATGINVSASNFSLLTGTNSGEIINCYSTSDLQGSASASTNFGAMAYKNNGTISRCYFAGQLKLTSTLNANKGCSNMAYENNGTITKSASYSSSKSPAGTVSSRSGITGLVSDSGYLKSNIWTDSRGGINSKYPYITNGILLTKNYGDGYEITTVEDLNDWIESNGSVDENKSIIININYPTESTNSVVGYIKENNGTIKIQNFCNVNKVQINEKFIEKNNGTINVGYMNNLMIRGWFVENNNGTIDSTAQSENLQFNVDSEDSTQLGGFVKNNGSSATTTPTASFSAKSSAFNEDTFVVKNNNATATINLNDVSFSGNTGGFAEDNASGSTIELSLVNSSKVPMTTNKGNLVLSSISGSMLNIVNNVGNITSSSTPISNSTLNITNHGAISDGTSTTESTTAVSLSGLSLNTSSKLIIDTIYSKATVDITGLSGSETKFTVTTNKGTINNVSEISGGATMNVTTNAGTIGSINYSGSLSNPIVTTNTGTINSMTFGGGSISSPVVTTNSSTITNLIFNDTSFNGDGVVGENSGEVSIEFSNMTSSKVVIPTNNGTVRFTSTDSAFNKGIIDKNLGTVKSISITGGSMGQPAIIKNEGELAGEYNFNSVSLSSSSDYVGLLFGTSTGTLGDILVNIEKCTVGVSGGNSAVGMIGGFFDNGTGSTIAVNITNNCIINTTSNSSAVGGAIGFIASDSKITIKENASDTFEPTINVNKTILTSEEKPNTGTGVGGVVGVIGTSSEVTISGAFTPQITMQGNGECIGGIVGQTLGGTLGLKLWSYANITTNPSASCRFIGGVVGYCWSNEIIGDGRGSTTFDGIIKLNGAADVVGGIFGYVSTTKYSNIYFSTEDKTIIEANNKIEWTEEPVWKNPSGKINSTSINGNSNCYSANALLQNIDSYNSTLIWYMSATRETKSYVYAQNFVICQNFSINLGTLVGKCTDEAKSGLSSLLNSMNGTISGIGVIKVVEIVVETISYETTGGDGWEAAVRLTTRIYSLSLTKIDGINMPKCKTGGQPKGNDATWTKNTFWNSEYSTLNYGHVNNSWQTELGKYGDLDTINLISSDANMYTTKTVYKNDDITKFSNINSYRRRAGLGDDKYGTAYKNLTGESHEEKMKSIYIQIL